MSRLFDVLKRLTTEDDTLILPKGRNRSASDLAQALESKWSGTEECVATPPHPAPNGRPEDDTLILPKGRNGSASDLARALESKWSGAEECVSTRGHPAPDSRLVSMQDMTSLGAEKFRSLASRLRHQRNLTGLKTVVVTSATAAEGKSFIAANLAITLARQSKHKTLLLEGDLRKPVLAGMFGLNGISGLSHLLSSPETVTPRLCCLEDVDLHFLPVGKPAENSFEVLQSKALVDLLDRLKAQFDWIIVDSPPMIPLADVNVWSRLADGILLVVREGKAPKSAIQRGLESLDHPNLVGVVLNAASGPDHDDYQQYYSPHSRRDKAPS